MRLKLYWLHKLRAFKTRGFQTKNRSIVATSDRNLNKDNTFKNTDQANSHIKSSFIDASRFEKTPLKHRKPSSRLSQVVASLGCGSTVPLRLRKERHKPKVYSEEEDRLQAPPLATFGGINKGFTQKGKHLGRHEDNYFFKEGCLDPHATTRRWVGACRCIQDVASVDNGSSRFDETLLSRNMRKELRSPAGQSSMVSSTENKPKNKGIMSKTHNHSLVQNATVKETHLASGPKQIHFRIAEGSMSDRIVVDQKRVDTEAKTLKRWSSASVRDYMNLKGNLTPGDSMQERSIGSISCSKERSLRTSYDERFRNASFDRRQRPSITSVSTLSSYDFDRVSHWGSYDATNTSFNPTNTGNSWQGDIMEERNAHQSVRKKSQRSAFSTRDPDASVTVYTLSDCEDDEEEHGLLHTVSHARAWLNRYVDDDEDDDDDDDDDEYADCFIDLEANAKAWATAWALSSSDMRLNSSSHKGSSSTKHEYVNSTATSHRSQRELDAAALKRKYHKEFAGKEQAIVVSSHYEDNMNTFMFPPMSDQEDDLGANPSKIFDYTAKNHINKVDQEAFMIDSKRPLSGDKGHSYHSLAVEKKSRNPYVDFRDSMVDMVLQKQIYKSSELEELLQSFLCLNSLEHHDLIVQAFSEVWEKVFGSINYSFHKKS